mgnify:CR=1 FL=1
MGTDSKDKFTYNSEVRFTFLTKSPAISFFYMVERVIGYGNDDENLFALVCFNYEQYSPFSFTVSGDIDYYRTEPLDAEVCVAAKGYAIEHGHIHSINKINATQ